MSSPSKPPKLPLSLILALHPAKIDAFLSHLHRCLQTPAGVDTVLLFICYTSRLASSLLTSASAARLQASARALLSNLVVAGAASEKLRGVAVDRVQAARSLRALSDLLSEFRMFTRLWSLLGLYQGIKGLAARELSGQAAALGAFDRAMPWLQLGSCVALQVLENGAFLAMKGVLPLKRETIGWSMTWSSRFFAAYVGLELGKLLVEKIRKERGEGAQSEKDVELAAWRENWNRSFVKSLAWMPLTIHWSLEKGLVPDMAVGALATVPGVIQMSKLWRDTA